MNCSKCGALVSPGAVICQACGNSIDPSTNVMQGPAPTVPTSPVPNVQAVIDNQQVQNPVPMVENIQPVINQQPAVEPVVMPIQATPEIHIEAPVAPVVPTVEIQPVVEQPIVVPVAPVVETQPVVEAPVVQPAPTTPIVPTMPVVEQPIVVPTTDQSIFVAPEPAPAVEIPVVPAPTVETPIVEPVIEQPVVETPVIETPAVEVPVVEPITVMEPVVETPVAQAPTSNIKFVHVDSEKDMSGIANIEATNIPLEQPQVQSVSQPVEQNPNMNFAMPSEAQVASAPTQPVSTDPNTNAAPFTSMVPEQLPTLDQTSVMPNVTNPSILPEPTATTTGETNGPAPEKSKKKGNGGAIVILILIIILGAAAAYIYFNYSTLGGGKYEKYGINMLYNYKWKLDITNNKVVFTHSDKESTLTLSSVEKILSEENSGFNIQSDGNRKILFDKYKGYISPTLVDNGYSEVVSENATFMPLANDTYYGVLTYRNSKDTEQTTKYYIYLDSKTDTAITYILKIYNAKLESAASSDTVKFLQKISISGNVAYTENQKTFLPGKTNQTEITNYISLKTPEMWTVDSTKSNAEEKTYVFNYKDNISTLTMKVGDGVTNKKASVLMQEFINTTITTENTASTNSLTMNNVAWTYIISKPYAISATDNRMIHNELYHAVSSDDNHYYYLLFTKSDSLKDDDLKLIDESIEYIIRNTILSQYGAE